MRRLISIIVLFVVLAATLEFGNAGIALADCSVDAGVALAGFRDYEAYVQEGNRDMASISWGAAVHEIDVAENDDGNCGAQYADMELHYWADAIRRGADHPGSKEQTLAVTQYIRAVYDARAAGAIDEPDWSDLAMVIKPYADKYHLPLMPKWST